MRYFASNMLAGIFFIFTIIPSGIFFTEIAVVKSSTNFHSDSNFRPCVVLSQSLWMVYRFKSWNSPEHY